MWFKYCSTFSPDIALLFSHALSCHYLALLYMSFGTIIGDIPWWFTSIHENSEGVVVKQWMPTAHGSGIDSSTMQYFHCDFRDLSAPAWFQYVWYDWSISKGNLKSQVSHTKPSYFDNTMWNQKFCCVSMRSLKTLSKVGKFLGNVTFFFKVV